MHEAPRRTWDGLPVSVEAPFGACVVVWRRGAEGAELLLLHRAHRGPAYDGDWAWTPPSGARLPGEPVETCAARELFEETGLRLAMRETDAGTEQWRLFVAEAPAGAEIRLDAEHDAYGWVPAAEAAVRCRPAVVGEGVARVVGTLAVSEPPAEGANTPVTP
jgi:8-oxo-dGTP pyrophosphatase MutT (NUDIX family)